MSFLSLPPRRVPVAPAVYPIAAIALVAGSQYFSAVRGWNGEKYCVDPSDEDSCGDPFVAWLLPYVLWAVAVVTTCLVCVVGRWVRPASRSARLAWASALGVSVLVANRHNVGAAIVATSISVVFLLWNDEAVGTRGRESAETAA